jgi:molybdopterin-guanine dinucleotide biosynthesis adapter protein
VKVIIFLGYSNSGKTTALTRIVSQLVKDGKKVGTLKHIHDEDFTIDTEGKDTWRHASAGATTVVALAPKEVAIIEKGDTRDLTIDGLFDVFSSRSVDYLLIEGLYRKLSRRKGVTRILCARTLKDARELLRIHPRPVCILNHKAKGETSVDGIPVFSLPQDMGRLMRLIGERS